MRTESPIKASRANGAKSRGPVTAAGNRTSSENALRHGAFAHAILLKTEYTADFNRFSRSLHDEFQPQTPFETSLVESMIAARWRQMRMAVMEQALMQHEIDRLEELNAASADNAAIAALSFRALADESHAIEMMNRCESRFERQYLRAHRRLLEVQDRGATPPPRLSPENVVPIRSVPEAGPEIRSTEQTRQVSENEQPDSSPIQTAARASLRIFLAAAGCTPRPRVSDIVAGHESTLARPPLRLAAFRHAGMGRLHAESGQTARADHQ